MTDTPLPQEAVGNRSLENADEDQTERRQGEDVPRDETLEDLAVQDEIESDEEGGSTESSVETDSTIVERADGSKRRRMTVYLELDVAKRLGFQSVEENKSKTEVVNDALKAYLPEEFGV